MQDSELKPVEPKGGVMNKKWLILIAAVIVLIVGIAAWFTWTFVQDRAQEETPPASVAISSEGFTPSTIVIKKGEDVEWVNQDNIVRGVQGDQEDLGFGATGALNPGESYSFVFDDPGTYTYHDPLKSEFKGTVVVE